MSSLQSDGFDRLARPYRWMEWLTFGRVLQRCRMQQLPLLVGAEKILLLGDGDGRFAEALLCANLTCNIVALDRSSGMLRALQQRSRSIAPQRLNTMRCDLAAGLPTSLDERGFDAVVTHFFLDCLTTDQVQRLAADVHRYAAKDAVWIVSEFAIPDRGGMRLPATALVRWLYFCFRVLTGLRVQQLPRYEEAMTAAGWRREHRETLLGGLLASEAWRRAS